MTQLHEPPTVVREREVHEIHDSDSGSSMGLGMVLGVILVLGLVVTMLWFLVGTRVFGNNPNLNNPVVPLNPPAINIQPPNIDIDKPNITINPPAQPPQGSAPSGQ